eukprot:PhF_6_TR708/c0_g1_i2/m.1168/K07964/HPSE; heparanase
MNRVLAIIAIVTTYVTAFNPSYDTPLQNKVSINFSSVLSTLPANYISANFDWNPRSQEYPAWIHSSIMKINLTDENLVFLASKLAPGYLRIGGTYEDKATYATPTTPQCGPPPINITGDFCLNMTRWQEINEFGIATGMRVLFGLNSMLGRRNSTDALNFTMIEGLLRYTAQHGAKWRKGLAGFEFGNEVQTEVNPVTLANDYLTLRRLLNKYFPDDATRPILVGPDNNIDIAWSTKFLPIAAPALNATTYHIYIGYGLDPKLPIQAWTASFLAQSASQGKQMSDLVYNTLKLPKSLKLFVGETALAWHSGQDGTTNAFSSGAWYITQLGSLMATHSTQCRQTLKGGYYELVNKTTMKPNPDWWTAVLWKLTMGNIVLGATYSDSNVPTYATCSTTQNTFTIAFVNTHNNTSVELDVSGVGLYAVAFREEWILTATTIHSNVMMLNGAELWYEGPGRIASIDGVIVNSTQLGVQVPPLSYGYIRFHFVKFAPSSSMVCGN